MDRITVTMDNGVADVRLNRVDKMNALDDAMFAALISVGERLRDDPKVRVVVLSGEGKAFCAGLDMGNFGRMAEGSSEGSTPVRGNLETRTHGIANRAQHAVMVWRQIPVPVIAAIHGVAFGGGFQVALGADIRYMRPDARMSVMEIKWGLVPDMAGTVLMRSLAREDVVRELTFSGRIFNGVEAKEYGFATRLCEDPLAEALAYAHEVAAKNPDAIRAGKVLLNMSPDADAAALLLAESVEQDKIIGKPNQVEAVRAQMEKRAPVFVDKVA